MCIHCNKKKRYKDSVYCKSCIAWGKHKFIEAVKRERKRLQP